MLLPTPAASPHAGAAALRAWRPVEEATYDITSAGDTVPGSPVATAALQVLAAREAAVALAATSRSGGAGGGDAAGGSGNTLHGSASALTIGSGAGGGGSVSASDGDLRRQLHTSALARLSLSSLHCSVSDLAPRTSAAAAIVSMRQQRQQQLQQRQQQQQQQQQPHRPPTRESPAAHHVFLTAVDVPDAPDAPDTAATAPTQAAQLEATAASLPPRPPTSVVQEAGQLATSLWTAEAGAEAVGELEVMQQTLAAHPRKAGERAWCVRRLANPAASPHHGACARVCVHPCVCIRAGLWCPHDRGSWCRPARWRARCTAAPCSEMQGSWPRPYRRPPHCVLRSAG